MFRSPATTAPTFAVWLRIVVGLTIFLSAFLLFQVQPLMSKAILPWFGGSAGVWTLCVLLFQFLLLAGYALAHIGLRWLTAGQWLLVQVGLLAVAAWTLPITPDPAWRPTSSGAPERQILLILLASVGVPFLILSTTAPLVQAWFARTQPGRSPYRWYALSNAGSLLALVTYPFVVEVYLSVPRQAVGWSIGFAMYAVLYALGIAAMIRLDRRMARVGSDGAGRVAAALDDSPTPSWWRVAWWFLLAAIPSAMLVATTNQVCLDIASVPFLWVLPLGLYLLSFILCFESERWSGRWIWAALVAFSSAGMLAGLLWDAKLPIVWQVVVFFWGMFAAAMFCHGELARARPAPQYLSSFYLALAAGGAAGGVAVGLVAPLIFSTYLEMQMAILATLLVVVASCFPGWAGRRPTKLQLAGWLGTVAILALISIGLAYDITRESKFAVITFRNFYGVLRVKEYDRGQPDHSIALLNGRIAHGDQFLAPERRRLPTTYYGPQSGIGQALSFRADDAPRRVAVVGLGVGTLAAYARPGDLFRFYELNPAVESIARNVFTFLGDCPGTVEVRLGDARLQLEREQTEVAGPRWDVIAIDAFSSDAIPTHLLTREATALYLERLQPDGLLCLHISNRHFDLNRVVAGLVREFGLAAELVINKDDGPNGVINSSWVLLARDPARLEQLALTDRFPLEPPTTVLWTDNYCNPFTVLKAWVR